MASRHFQRSNPSPSLPPAADKVSHNRRAQFNIWDFKKLKSSGQVCRQAASTPKTALPLLNSSLSFFLPFFKIEKLYICFQNKKLKSYASDGTSGRDSECVGNGGPKAMRSVARAPNSKIRAYFPLSPIGPADVVALGQSSTRRTISIYGSCRLN